MSVLLPLLLVLPALPQAAPTPKAFDELLLRYAASGWSGAVLISDAGEPVLAGGYGFADFQSDRANDEHTLFEIASITKSFTAVAIVELAQQKKLGLDDPIHVHLPAVPKHSREITLRQLLAHTSGIPRGNTGGRGDDLALAVVDYLGTGPAVRPGARFEYWNGGYALLAGVIEQASRRPYTQFLEEELFAPAGMSETCFTGDMEVDVTRAARGATRDGYERSALLPPYGSYGYQYRGMGGIVTSVSDLLRWDRALASHAILDEDHTRELFEPVMSGYALGWYVAQAPGGGARQSHGGSVRGFVSEFRRYPERDACIAVLSNVENARPSEIAENLECLLYGRAPAVPPPRVEALSAAEAASLAGSYACEAGRLVVRSAPGVLMAGIEGEALLARVGASGQLGWQADLELLSRRAAEIVDGIARGNTEPLRTHMAKRIPKSWPDQMRRSIWPAQLAQHGAFRGVRPIGDVGRGERVEVLLALDHEKGPTRALVSFGPAGLEKLDWRGPWFLASARLEPLRKGTFRMQLGEEPVKLEFELGGERPFVRLGALKLERQ